VSPRPVAFLPSPLGSRGSHTRRCEPRPSACVPLLPYRPSCALDSWFPERSHPALRPCFPAAWHRMACILCAVLDRGLRSRRHEPPSSEIHPGHPSLRVRLATASCTLRSRRPPRSDSSRSPQLPVLSDHRGGSHRTLAARRLPAPKSLHLPERPPLGVRSISHRTAPKSVPRPVHTWTFGVTDPTWGPPGRGQVPTGPPPTPRCVRPLCLESRCLGSGDPSPWDSVIRVVADAVEAPAPATRSPRTRRVLRALPRSQPWPPQGPFPGPGSSSPGHPPPCPVGSVQDSIKRGSRLQGLAPLTSPLRLPAVSSTPAPVAPLGFYVPPRPLPPHRSAC